MFFAVIFFRILQVVAGPIVAWLWQQLREPVVAWVHQRAPGARFFINAGGDFFGGAITVGNWSVNICTLNATEHGDLTIGGNGRAGPKKPSEVRRSDDTPAAGERPDVHARAT
ncbi:hypothetical protein BC834DRAFT_846943 [Gloeopeniophorella convolvens]|nr:hypothetical protein BC834DRAFT_846943 [Gloeopeniophorella convolvens]